MANGWNLTSSLLSDRFAADAKKRLTPGASILHFHAPRWFPFNPNRVASSGELASRGTAHRYRAKLGDHRPSLRTCFTTPTTHPYRVSPKKCTLTTRPKCSRQDVVEWKPWFRSATLVYVISEFHTTLWSKLNRVFNYFEAGETFAIFIFRRQGGPLGVERYEYIRQSENSWSFANYYYSNPGNMKEKGFLRSFRKYRSREY